MAKSYLNDARRHAEKIKYYYDHAGANGHSQALYHYHELGECYSKSARRHDGDAAALQIMYVNAGKLMEEMKAWEDAAKKDEKKKPDEPDQG